MPDTRKPLIFLIYSDLVNAVTGIAEKTYLDRPKATASEIKSFIVVDIPTEVRPRIRGAYDVSVECEGVFYIFCKAKTDGTPNIGAQTSLLQGVLDIFPINGTHCVASRPTVLMEGPDGYGYHVTEVSFTLRTRFNARDIQS